MSTNRVHAKRGVDGLAIIGRTLHDLRGIRFDEGEEGNEPAVETEDTGPSVDVLQAAIADRDNTIADLTAQLAAKDTEITGWKAANYDLLLQIPGNVEDDTPEADDTEDDDLGDDFLYETED